LASERVQVARYPEDRGTSRDKARAGAAAAPGRGERNAGNDPALFDLDPDVADQFPPFGGLLLFESGKLIFYDPDFETVVECLPNCSSKDNPPKYQRTVAGEYITAQYDKAYAYRR
jgi:hypothetical protein